MRALAAAALSALALAAGACSCGGAGPGAALPGGAAGSAPQATAAAPVTVIAPYPTAAAAPAPPAVPPAERELLRAYARHWELYAAALLSLDGSRLPEVMTGPRLERAREEIARLRLSGRAVRVDVESAPVVGMLRGEEAVIVDRYRNQSYLLDRATGRPVAARGVATTVHATVSLVLEEGSWKVRDSVREGRSP